MYVLIESDIQTYGSPKHNTVYDKNGETVVKWNGKGRDPSNHQSEVVDDEGVGPWSVRDEADEESGHSVTHTDNGDQESALGFLQLEILCQIRQEVKWNEKS